MRTTLVVCESPWSTDKGLIESHSVRPFVEGLCELHRARLVYRTFTTGEELKWLVNHEAVDGRRGRAVVYIACHGDGGRLTVGRLGDRRINLGRLALYLRRGVEGVWLGACDVGRSNALEDFLGDGAAVWAGGYVCSVRWNASLLLDLAVLEQVMLSGPIRGPGKLIRVLTRALAAFSPNWTITTGARDRVSLRSALRVIARDKLRGHGPKEVSDQLRTSLGWEAAKPARR